MSYESAIVKLAEVIVGVGGQATIAFSSIPQTYRALQLDIHGRGDTAAGSTTVSLQFNGDTGTNYDREFGQTSGSSALNGGEVVSGTSMAVANIPAATASSNMAGGVRIIIPNYALTTFDKNVWAHGGFQIGTSSGNTYMVLMAGLWRSTAAITSILLFPASGNFVQNSVCSLYGVL
jgi:hypothetical protein